jgi:hypothetical protein
LANQGTVPATDINIHLSFPLGTYLEMVSAMRPSIPEKPKVDVLSAFGDMFANLQHPAIKPVNFGEEIRKLKEENVAPIKALKRERSRIEFGATVRRAKHHYPVAIGSIFLTVAPDVTGVITFGYAIHTAELPEAVVPSLDDVTCFALLVST